MFNSKSFQSKPQSRFGPTMKRHHSGLSAVKRWWGGTEAGLMAVEEVVGWGEDCRREEGTRYLWREIFWRQTCSSMFDQKVLRVHFFHNHALFSVEKPAFSFTSTIVGGKFVSPCTPPPVSRSQPQHPQTRTRSLSLSLSHTHSSPSLSRTHTHTHSSPSGSLSHTHTRPLYLPHILSHTHSRTHTHTHTHTSACLRRCRCSGNQSRRRETATPSRVLH